VYTPHVVTLYNVSENPETLEQDYNITVLKGVFLDRSHARNIEKSGLRDADSATLFIPFSVDATDGVSGLTKQYIGPKAYRDLADPSDYWTLEAGGNSSGVDCFFIKGEVVTKAGYRYIRENYDNVYDVTTVDERDFGSTDMQHWQVGGR
jgi:hypothetical protein